MKLYQIQKRKKYMIMVERMQLMMLNKNKIRVKDIIKEEILSHLIWEEMEVGLEDSILKIFLQVHLVVEWVAVEEDKKDKIKDSILKKMMDFKIKEKRKRNPKSISMNAEISSLYKKAFSQISKNQKIIGIFFTTIKKAMLKINFNL
jgi:hypothetical protein